VKYLQNLFKAFSVRETILGDGHSDGIKHSILILKEVEFFFQNITGQAKTHLNLNITDLQGLHRVPASKRVKSIKIIIGMLVKLLETVIRINPNFVSKMDIRSVLTLVSENLHSILRLRVDTSSVLDCARDFVRGLLEFVKKRTLCGFHYFTSKKSPGYEAPKGMLLFQYLLKITPEKPVKLCRENVKLLLQFREKYGKGVRQRSVRSDTTKYRPGTLPLNLYNNNPLPSCSNIDFSHPNEHDLATASNDTAPQNNTHLYEMDDYLAVM
jgi:hypothetical protein